MSPFATRRHLLFDYHEEPLSCRVNAHRRNRNVRSMMIVFAGPTRLDSPHLDSCKHRRTWQKLESRACLARPFHELILPEEYDSVWRRKSKQISKCKNGSMREDAAICLTARYRWPGSLG